MISSGDAEVLVRLDGQPPLGMALTIRDRFFGILPEPGPVHGLNEIVLEIQGGQGLEIEASLGNHHLQFVSRHYLERRPGLGTDANPIDGIGQRQGAIRLDRHFEPVPVKSRNQRLIELQGGLSPREYDESMPAVASLARPTRQDPLRERRGIDKPASSGPIGTHEIRIAEPADGGRSIPFQPAPEIAAAEPAEHRRPARLGAFALQRGIDFLDRVGHWRHPFGFNSGDYIRDSTRTIGNRSAGPVCGTKGAPRARTAQ